MEIIFIQDIMHGKKSHYWYGGKVVEIEYKGYTFSIEAVGDVKATLYKDGEPFAYIKDKGNNGYFDSEMSPYIENDEDLYDLIGHGDLIFDNNNWWECYVVDRTGQFHDLMWALDSSNIYDAIEEVADHADEVIEEIEKDLIYNNLEEIVYHLDNIDEEGFSNAKIVSVIKEIIEKITGVL